MLEVEVGNFTPNVRKVTVEVTLGRMTRRLGGTCPAQGRVVLSDELESATPGWQWGRSSTDRRRRRLGR